MSACVSGSPESDDWLTVVNGDLSNITTEGNWKVDGTTVWLEPRPGEKGWDRFGSYIWLKEDYSDFVCEFEFKFRGFQQLWNNHSSSSIGSSC